MVIYGHLVEAESMMLVFSKVNHAFYLSWRAASQCPGPSDTDLDRREHTIHFDFFSDASLRKWFDRL